METTYGLTTIEVNPLQHRVEERIRLVQNVIQNARKAGITKKITQHILWHCIATYLLDNGTNVRFIQEHSGHKNEDVLYT